MTSLVERPVNEHNLRNYGIHKANPAISVDFLSKLKYESKVSSTQTRSELFKVAETSPTYNIWTLQPPDFNPQAFKASPVKRKLEELARLKAEYEIAVLHSKAAPNAAERRRNDKRLRDLFKELKEMAEAEQQARTRSKFRNEVKKPTFKVRFQPLDSQQSKIEFTRHGIHKREAYTAPQLHDYRQYPPIKTLGLPEFITAYERDCFGLKCKTRGLSIMQGQAVNFLREVPVRSRSDYAMPRHLKWDNQLVLPKLPFPNKIAAYTRHRRTDRSARSAFLESAEEMMIKRSREIEEFKKSFHKSKNEQAPNDETVV